jgi:filamentous hemagglutinin
MTSENSSRPVPARRGAAAIHALIVLQVLQPFSGTAWAGGVNPVTGGVTVDQAANGVPVVNIAKPNAAGISHNRYSQFNVGTQGLILNNSAQPVNSQLGGYITGNANLGAGSARLILNEVTAASPSLLRGYMEVAGARAGVVVANPYGITCDGCGFINTSLATLSTGAPRWNSDGTLQGFDVQGGTLRIDGLGLNADNTERLALYARTLELNAALYASALEVVTGANLIDAETGMVTAQAGTGTAPAYAIDSTALGGMYAGTIRLVGTEAGVGMRLAAPVAALTGHLEILANGDVRMARSSAQGRIDIQASGDVQFAEAVTAGGDLAVTVGGALALADGAQVAAEAVSLNAASVAQAAGSTVSARGSVAVSAAEQQFAGTLGTAGTLALQGDAITNAGHLAAAGGLVLEADSFRNAGQVDVAAGAATFTVAGAFNNADGVIRHGGDALGVQAQQLGNAGGEIASEGSLDIHVAGSSAIDNAAGLLQGNAGILLTSTGLDSRGGEVVSNSDITLALGESLLQNDAGLVETTGSIVVTAGGLANAAGALRAGQDFTLWLPAFARAASGGELLAQGVLALHTNGDIVIDGAELATPGSVWLDAGSAGVRIDSRLVSGGDTRITAGSVALGDTAVVAAQAQLQVVADAVSNRGVLFGRTGIQLQVESQLSNGDATQYEAAYILSEGDIHIATAADGRVGVVNNFGGLIESQAGDITLRAEALNNVNVDWSLSATERLPSTFEYSIGETSFNTYHYCCDRWGEDVHSTRTETRVDRTTFASRGHAGRIVAQGDITLDLGDLLNEHSTISAAGVLDITADSITNRGTTLYDAITKLKVTRWHTCEYDDMGDLDCWPVAWGPLTSHSESYFDNLPAILEGGVDVILRGGVVVNGEPERRGSTQASDEGAFAGLAVTPDDVPSPGNLQLGIADPTSWPGFQLPGNGLFHLNGDPAHPYLIETDPALNTYDGFLGSAYLLSHLEGWAPEITQRRLGDGYYELMLVRDALLASLGTRFIDPAIADERTQFEYLMNNAIAASDSLHLSPGIALTREQIDALVSDIVWMEERRVGDHEVLVPVVYLAQGSTRVLRDGSVIGGGALSVESDTFTNAGLVQARGSVSVNAADLLANLGGTIRAGGDLALQSGGDLLNESGQLSGDNVRLAAVGDIVHRTSSTEDQEAAGGMTASTTRVGDTATVTARGDMLQVAGGTLQLSGAALSGVNVTLAGENIVLDTVKTSERFAFTTADWQEAEERVRHLQTEVVALQELRLLAASDITAVAASLRAGGDATLAAGGSVSLLAAEESDHQETQSQHDGSVVDSRSDMTHDASRMLGSSISAGGNLALSAHQGDVTLYASSATAGGAATVAAGGAINLIAGVDTVSHSEQRNEESAATFENHSEGYVRQEAVASRIASGGDLRLITTGDVNVVASTLASGATLRIGDVTVDPATLTILPLSGSEVAAIRPLNLNVTTLALTNTSWNETQKGFTGPMEELVRVVSAGAALFLNSYVLGMAELPELSIGEHENTRSSDVLQAGSSLYAQHLAIGVRERATFIGAQVEAPGTIGIAAQDIVIDAAAETHDYRHESGNDTVQGLGANFDRDKGEYRIGGVQETRTSVSDQQSVVEWKGSTIAAGNLILQADNNIEVLGSQLDVVGNAILAAGGDLTLGGREGSVATTHEEKTEVITLAAAVRNAYHDAVQAIEAVSDAKKALQAAKDALDVAERKVALGQLAANDIDFFRVNVAAAAANLAQATIGAAGALAAAATTAAGSAGTGFYATGSATHDTMATTSSTTQTVWQGSTLAVGGNALLTAAHTLQVKGSEVVTAGVLALEADTIDITAGTEHFAQDSKTTESHENVGVNVTPGTISANVGLSTRQTDADSTALHYVNSQVSAGTLVSRSDVLRVVGAQVMAEDVDIETRELFVASLQDESRSQSETSGGSVGMSFGYGDPGMSATSASGGIEQSESSSSSRWVAQQTQIIGSNSIRVRAVDTVMTGAVIANAEMGPDGQLVDKGNLDFATETLAVNDLQDYQYSKTTGFNFSTTLNTTAFRPDVGGEARGQTTLGGQYFGHETDQVTRATLGLGKVVVGGQELTSENAAALGLSGLNRDLGLAQEIIRDQDIGGLNASVSIDNRWFAEGGPADIAEDLLSVGKNIQIVATGMAKDINLFLPSENSENPTISLFNRIAHNLGLPRESNSGGMLAEIPIIVGAKDVNGGTTQQRDKDDPYALMHPDLFKSGTTADGYEGLEEPGQMILGYRVISDMNFLLSEDNATMYYGTNGMMNPTANAYVNILEQSTLISTENMRSSVAITNNYQGTHGALPDILEAGVELGNALVNKYLLRPIGAIFGVNASVAVTGDTKQAVQFYIDMKGANGVSGAYVANHSQGNNQNIVALQVLGDDFFPKDPITGEAIYKFATYGSPIPNAMMQAEIERAGGVLMAAGCNVGDFICQGIGSNRGNFVVQPFSVLKPDIGSYTSPLFGSGGKLDNVIDTDALSLFGDKYPFYSTNTTGMVSNKYIKPNAAVQPNNEVSPHSMYGCLLGAACGDAFGGLETEISVK